MWQRNFYYNSKPKNAPGSSNEVLVHTFAFEKNTKNKNIREKTKS